MTTKLQSIALVLFLLSAPAMTGCAVDVSEQVGNLSDEIRLPGRFTVFEAANGEFYFNLKAGNGEVILQSEGYKSQSGAQDGIDAVKTYGVDMNHFVQRDAENGQHYFVLRATNQEVIGVSELYTTAHNSQRGALAVRSVIAKILHLETALEGGAYFDLFEGQDGQFYFNLVAANHEIVLSSEGYVQRAAAVAGIDSVRAHGRDLHNFDILEAKNGQFYFNLKAANHQIIGTGETYVSWSNAKHAASTIAALLYSERVADPQE